MTPISSPASASADALAVAHHRQNDALGGFGLVAEELGGADLLAQREPDRLGRRLARSDPAPARFLALPLHRRREALDRHPAALTAQHVLGQIERETEGVVEPEGDLAGQRRAGAEPRRLLFEQAQPAVEHLLEVGFLEPQCFRDQRLRAQQFGIGGAHLLHQRRHQPPHQRIPAAEHMRVPHRPAHDPAQHIAAPLLARQHAVGDQEGRGAQMIGDHAMRDRVRPVRRDAGGFRRGQDQSPEEVDVVIVVLALQDRGDAFEPHAGIDRGARQRDPLTRAHLVELREDEVPDFDEAVAFRIGASRRTAGNGRAVIVKDLRARAARSDVAHHPEIVRGGDADDLRLRQPGDLRPQAGGLVVFGIDRHQQAIAGEPELASDQVPGQLDRPVLEVIAKGEIPQHLEKRMMPGGIADVFQIVVLAAGAHAFLRRGGALVGPLLQAGEDVLELHHAGIGEQQCRIVARHERARRDDLVLVARKIVEKSGADVVGRLHRQILALRADHTRGEH